MHDRGRSPDTAARAGTASRPDTTAARRVLVVAGHPRRGSLTAKLAETFADGARDAGCSVEMLHLSDLEFDPDVLVGSPASQAMERDLARSRDLIEWAGHIVFVFPNWWGMMPARLKGFLDRVLYPGFAFREADGHYYGLLAPRTAELLITMDVPPLVYRWIQGAPGQRAMSRATLGLCGVKTVAVTTFSPPSHTDTATRAGWIAQARELGARLRDDPRRPIRRRLHAAGALDPLAFVFGPGEMDVALTRGPRVLMLGHMMQGGRYGLAGLTAGVPERSGDFLRERAVPRRDRANGKGHAPWCVAFPVQRRVRRQTS